MNDHRGTIRKSTTTSLLDADLLNGNQQGTKERVCADLSDPAEVAEALAAYLEPRLGVGKLGFTSEPREVPDNWETHIYRFQLRAERPLPQAFAAMLVLRAYSSFRSISRARHDFVVQRHMSNLGYEVPAPLLVEDSCDVLGGPFLVMSWIPGETLLERLRQRFRLFLWVAEKLAEMHLRLHALSSDGFPSKREPFLDRRLEDLRAMIRAHGLEGLERGLNWLLVHRPAAPEQPRILHLDFHPINVVVQNDRVVAVLDWSDSDVGDFHADVATTLVLLRSAPVTTHTVAEHLLSGPARWALRRRYLRTYSRLASLDKNLLRYYVALASLRRLAVCGVWLLDGPESTGFKASSIEYVTSGQIKALEQCFHKSTRVRARLEGPASR
jgi:aminoglycoside phosphotransferase (APT) family kinase protein